MATVSRLGRQVGVTLVELLVALAIGAIIASALAVVFSESVKNRERVNRESVKIENGRYALDVVADDVRLAGYWGEYLPPSDTKWQTPNPCNTATASLGWSYSEVTPDIPVPVFGQDGHTTVLSTSDLSCLTNLKAGSSILVLRRVSTVGVAPVGTLPGAAYLQNSSKTLELCGSSDPQRFAFSDSATALSLKWMDCTTAARAREFIVRTYYLATCNDADCALPDAQKIPTLKVAELKKVGGANSIVVRSLVPGVEDFRTIFGVDSAGTDGSVNGAYSAVNHVGVLTDNDADVATPVRWEDVVAVRLFLVVRDLEETPGYTNNRTFGLGGVTFTAPGDAYRREMVTTTVRLVNVAGRRGAP